MIVCDATVSIVPLVLSSLSLALCSMADSKRLGKIAGKTIGTFVGFYVCGATLAGLFAYFIKSMGWFSVNLPETTTFNAATLPLNRKTCMEELGCSKEISSFVLPMGMTINMNGTTAMHMVAITFIATAAGINITPTQLITAAFLSICVAMGTPAIPIAGTTLIFVIMSGLGLSSDLCMVAYALVLAISYLPGMAVITLNVVGDAATTVIVSYKENELDKDVYNS